MKIDLLFHPSIWYLNPTVSGGQTRMYTWLFVTIRVYRPVPT